MSGDGESPLPPELAALSLEDLRRVSRALVLAEKLAADLGLDADARFCGVMVDDGAVDLVISLSVGG